MHEQNEKFNETEIMFFFIIELSRNYGAEENAINTFNGMVNQAEERIWDLEGRTLDATEEKRN